MWCAVSSLSMILLIKTNLETSLCFCIILGEKILLFHSKDCIALCVCWAVVPPHMNAYGVPLVDAVWVYIHSQNYCSL